MIKKVKKVFIGSAALVLVTILFTVHAEVPSELKPLSDSFIHVQKSTDALYAMSEFIENSEVKTATGNLVRYLKSDLLPKLKKIRISKWIIPEPGSERMDNKKGKNYMKQLFMAINNFVKAFTKFGAETQAFMSMDLNGQASNKWLFMMKLKMGRQAFTEIINDISEFHRGKWQNTFLTIQDALTKFLISKLAQETGVEME